MITACFFLSIFITCMPLPSLCNNQVEKFDRLIPHKCSASTSCPPERNYDLRQLLCEYSCPEGKWYVCLEKREDKSIIEFCSTALKCDPGEMGNFAIDYNDPTKVSMKVTTCPAGRYQRFSSDCIDACKGSRSDFTLLPEHFVVYSNGSSIQPPQVYCNYTGGYYSSENVTFFDYDENFIFSFGGYCVHVSEIDPCVKGKMPLPILAVLIGVLIGVLLYFYYCKRKCKNGDEENPQDEDISLQGGYSNIEANPDVATVEENNEETPCLNILEDNQQEVEINGIIPNSTSVKRKQDKAILNGTGLKKEGSIPNGVATVEEINEETPCLNILEDNQQEVEINGIIPNSTSVKRKQDKAILNGTGLKKEGSIPNGVATVEEINEETPCLNILEDNQQEVEINGNIPNSTSVKRKQDKAILNGTGLKKEGSIPNGRKDNQLTRTNSTESEADINGSIPKGTNLLPRQDSSISTGTDKVSLGRSIRTEGEFKKKHDNTLTETQVNAVNTQLASVCSLIRMGDIAGTAFRVGEKYVMTACHVIFNIVKKDKGGPDIETNFDWSLLTTAGVYVNFNESITEKPKEVSKLICVYYNSILDVAVLEFQLMLDLPGRMALDSSTHLNPKDVCIIGFGHPLNNLKKHLDPSCKVIPVDNEQIRSAHEWLLGEGRLYRQKVDGYHFDLGYQGYDEPHKIIFDCFLEHGGSGAPVLAFDHTNSIKVVGHLTNGMPDFFFKLSKGDQESFPHEYRFEYGTRMRDIYKDMCEKKPNLAKDIFDENEGIQFQASELVPG